MGASGYQSGSLALQNYIKLYVSKLQLWGIKQGKREVGDKSGRGTWGSERREKRGGREEWEMRKLQEGRRETRGGRGVARGGRGGETYPLSAPQSLRPVSPNLAWFSRLFSSNILWFFLEFALKRYYSFTLSVCFFPDYVRRNKL